MSFDRRDAFELAARLRADLEAKGFDVCWEPDRTLAFSKQQVDSSDAVVAILSPGASGSEGDTLCLDELSFAVNRQPSKPILPVLAIACEAPLMVSLLQRVDMQNWERSEGVYEAGIEQLVRAIRTTLDAEQASETHSEPGPQRPTRVLIFVSYGHEDGGELARKLHVDLEAEDYEVLRDNEIPPGVHWDVWIRKAIEDSEVVLAILSPHAIRSEPPQSFCREEIQVARDLPRPIVPVIAIASAKPLLIPTLECIDMQGWRDPDAYSSDFRRLKEWIDYARAGKPRKLDPFVKKLNPDVELLQILDQGAFLARKRRGFTGRDWLFTKIDQWRKDPAGAPALLITGDPGSGKSAVVAQLVYKNSDGQVVAYHCCDAEHPDTLSAGTFVTNIAAMLASQLPEYAEAIAHGGLHEQLVDAGRDPRDNFEQGVIAPLSRLEAPADPPRYILVDGLDEILSGEAGRASITILDLLAAGMEKFPAWLRILATSRRRRAVSEKLTGATELVLDTHDERNLADVRAYLEQRIKDQALLALVKQSGRQAANVLEQLCRLADGSFVYAQLAADALADRKLAVEQLERLPPGLANLYEAAFLRTFEEPGSFGPCAQMLAVVVAARRALRRDQLEAILEIPDVEFERRRARLEPYLNYVEGTFSVFHKSLVDWLTVPETGTTEFHIDTARGERELLGWCRRWRGLEDDYPLRYLPAHLAERKEVDELLELLREGEFGRRRRAANVTPLLEIEDYAALSKLLLGDGRLDDLVELARTTSPYQRDGIALTLRTAVQSSEQAVRTTVDRLLAIGAGRHGDELAPELLSARVVGIETATYRGYADALLTAANDRSAAVRAILVPHLYRYWREGGEDGWRLLDGLGGQLIGRFGIPRQSQIEVSGGLSLAILTRDFEDAATVSRLGEFWRVTVRRLRASPLVRAAGRGLALKAAIAALTTVMRSQPEYQPLNLNELRRTFAGPSDHRWALAALPALERPEDGCGCVTDVLDQRTLEFDVHLMMVAERALVLHGARDPGPTLAAIEHIYRNGAAWFRQSCLYSAFHTLNVAAAVEPRWLDLYGELTKDFFHADRARLETAVGSYSFPPHLAWAEVVYERHRPTGKSQFLSRFFGEADEHADEPLCRTVITACHLLSFAYRRAQLALDALRDIVPNVPAEGALEETLVEVLANIRLYEDPSVDRFLAGLANGELATRVAATTPSVRANEFPTWMDSFVNHQLVTSDEFRAEMCGALRRAASVSSVRELLYDNVVWVLNMLAGERLVTAGG